jgi:hypothetical protein
MMARSAKIQYQLKEILCLCYARPRAIWLGIDWCWRISYVRLMSVVLAVMGVHALEVWMPFIH